MIHSGKKKTISSFVCLLSAMCSSRQTTGFICRAYVPLRSVLGTLINHWSTTTSPSTFCVERSVTLLLLTQLPTVVTAKKLPTSNTTAYRCCYCKKTAWILNSSRMFAEKKAIIYYNLRTVVMGIATGGCSVGNGPDELASQRELGGCGQGTSLHVLLFVRCMDGRALNTLETFPAFMSVPGIP